MKIAPIWRAMEKYNAGRAEGDTLFEPLLVHTGQHYDANMSEVFFRDLALPSPHYNLGIGGGTHGEQTGRVLIEFERILESVRPHMAGVVGDVNSTAACALATAKSYVLPGGRTPLLIHVEAGLRSRDRLMPEEINRVVTDAIADVLFTSEESGTTNLLAEGVSSERLHFVGNVMVDSLRFMLARNGGDDVCREYGVIDPGGHIRPFGMVTLHRPSNVDHPENLRRIVSALAVIGQSIPVLFPIHPRTRARMESLELFPSGGDYDDRDGGDGIRWLPPVGYEKFLALMSRSTFVITDSGGIQEETTALGIPCLTLRENTERPVTVTQGTNILIGGDMDRLLEEVKKILAGEKKTGQVPPLWDGCSAERIVGTLAELGKRLP